MPYADPVKRQAYYKERQAQRQNDPEYIAERNRRQRSRYQDPEYRDQVRSYQRAYRQRRKAEDPNYRYSNDPVKALERGRRHRGLIWTDEIFVNGTLCAPRVAPCVTTWNATNARVPDPWSRS